MNISHYFRVIFNEFVKEETFCLSYTYLPLTPKNKHIKILKQLNSHDSKGVLFSWLANRQ